MGGGGFGGWGGRVRGRFVLVGGQGGCERKIKVFLFFFGGGVRLGGGSGQM